MASRVHKKIAKKARKKGLLKKVVDYLISDCYMYAPLISSQPFDFSSTGVEAEKPIEEKKKKKKKKKKLVNKVGDYLKSDYYMYAPWLAPQSSLSATTTKRARPHKDHIASGFVPVAGKNIDQPQGAAWYQKKVTTTISEGKITKKKKQPNKVTAKVSGEAQPLDGYPPKKNIIVRCTTTAHKETVKHIVHQDCRPSSVPGKGIIEEERREVLVE